MSVTLAALVFCGSVVLTVVSTLVFARKLDRVSERLEFSEGLHGMVTALGADAPEISSAVVALAAGHQALGVGVLLGSNVFNLAGLLGVSALVAGNVHVHRHGLALNGGVALAVTALAAALVLGSTGAPLTTGLLAVVLVPYLVLLSVPPARLGRLLPGGRVRTFVTAAVGEEIEDLRRGERAPKASREDALTLLPALVAIVLGSVGMVSAATDLGDRWGVSDVVVGTLVLASLTSLPNLLTAVRLALHRRGSAVLSESLNSNSLNILAGLSLPALVVSLGSASGIVAFSTWWLLAMTFLVVVLAFARRGLRRADGLLAVGLYAVFAIIVATR